MANLADANIQVSAIGVRERRDSLGQIGGRNIKGLYVRELALQLRFLFDMSLLC